MAVMAGIAAALLAACSSAASGASGGGSSTPAQSAGVTYAKAQLKKYSGLHSTYGTPAPVSHPVNLRGKTIWYVPIGNIGVLQTMGTAMAQGLAKLGATVHVCDGKFEPTTIAGCMQTAATQNASAVVTNYVDYQSIPSAYHSLAAKGIPVLVSGETPPSGVKPTKDLAFLNANGVGVTTFRLMGDAVIADSNGSANVVVITLNDSPSTTLYSHAAVSEIKQHCPKCTVNTVPTLTADQSKLGSQVSAALGSNPDAGYLVLPQDPMYQFALTGLQSTAFSSKIKIVTSAGSPYGLEQVKAGKITYDIGQGAQYSGWGIADGVIRLLSGDTVLPDNIGAERVFSSANVGGLNLTAANYATSAWYGGTEWQKDFVNAWNGK